MSSEQLLVTVGLSATKFKNEMKGINTDLKTAEKNFKITEKSAQLMENKMDGLGKKLESLNRVYDTQTKKVEAYKKRMDELSTTKTKLQDVDTKLQAKMSELNKSLTEAEQTYGKNSKEANGLQKEISQLEKEISKNGKALDTANAQYDKFENELETAQLEADYTGQRINRLETDFNELGGSVNKINLDGFKDKLKSLGDTAAKVGRSINDTVLKVTGGAITGVGAGITAVGASITGLGTAMTAGFTVPFNRLKNESIPVFREFEKSISALKATTGATGAEMKQLEKKALELGGSTQKSAQEVADAMRYQALAGWDTKQIMEGTLPILNASVAGNIDLARTSDLITDSMSSLSIETKDLSGYLDKVAQTSRKANTDIDVMLEAFIKSGGSAKVLGIDLNTLSASIGVLANNGFKGAEGGRALQAILNRIGANKDVKETLDGIGASAFYYQGNFRGLETVLGTVHEKFKTMSTEQKAELAKKIAGDNYYSQFVALVDGMGGSFQSLKTDVENSNGVLQEMTDTMGDNLDGKIKRAESAFESFQITLGETAGKSAGLKADLAYLALSGFNKLPDPIKKVLILLANLIAIIGPILLVVGGLITAIGLLVVKLGLFISALAGCAAPMALVGYLVSMLIGTFIKFKDEITVAVEGVKTAIAENMQSVQDSFKLAWDTIKSIWDTIGTVTMNVMKDLIVGTCDIIAGLFPSISNSFSIVIQILNDLWTSYGVPLFQAIQDIISIAVDFVVTCLPGISNAFEIVTGIVKSIYESVFKPVFDGIKKVVGIVIDWFKQNAPQIAKVFNSVMDSLKKAWDTVGKPVFDILKTVISGAIEYVTPIVETLGKVFTAMVKGIDFAWTTFLKPVFDKLIEVAGWILSKALPPIRDFKDGVVDAMNLILTPIQWVIDKFSSLFDWAGKVGRSIGGFMDKLNPFKSAVSNLPSAPTGYAIEYEAPDISTLDLDHEIYSAKSPLSMGLNNVLNSNKDDTKSLLKELISLIKTENKSGDSNGSITIQIDNFNNNRETDIQTLAEELEFYRKNSKLRGAY